MKITDKIRLDWLNKKPFELTKYGAESSCYLEMDEGHYVTYRKKTIRQAIDAAIKAERDTREEK